MYKLTIIFIAAVATMTVEGTYFGEFSHHAGDILVGQHLDESFDHYSENVGHDFGLHHVQEHDLGGHFEHHDFSEQHEEEKHEPPKDYNFDYAVHDPHHHGYHSHQESSHGGVVKGYYSIKEADGSLREVHYTADKKNGFKAIVTKNGVQVHPHTDGSSHS